MNEEIKEILDYLKRSDKNKFGFEQGKFIDYEETQTLLDYITSLQQENERLNNIINELENILKLMINHGYYDTPNGDYEGTAVQGFMATGENSEFGVRAKFILDKLKELKEIGNNENK